ncbi:MarR family transcriptional regulator [Actinomyces sp. B33]|uniref:MarR family winged helix-turn-helix transcriptional regulator n=1 Tax=Actinomyces sp. B33 TaxID=2942131 RepID=UPI00233F7B48|nr:MarR family transcriptional regulator [Actinomyces sp. B33]MDC4233761.1 MarR family transcriptional regulator [Actinomyces sp. B33]
MTAHGMDEVDGIVSAWRRERPDLDTSPMSVLSRASRLARHLDLRRRTVFADHDLEPWEFDVLACLRRLGPPYAATPGQILAELLVSSGTMTNRIDRLESRGLVARSPSARDRRAIVVTLTPSGRGLVDEALAALLACEEEILSPIDDADRDEATRLLRALLLPLESADAARPSKTR